MSELDKVLKTVKAPEPSDVLKARILRDAKSMRKDATTSIAANDNRWKKWGALAATFLILGVVGVTTLSIPTEDTTETELWAETAVDLGYEDLYSWVNDEQTANTENENNQESWVKPRSIPT